MITVVELTQTNWNQAKQSLRNARRVSGGLKLRICLGKVAEGEVFPSHWQGIGSLRKRTVKLILTKPPEGMECLRNHVRHLVRASLTVNGGRFSDGRCTYCTRRMSNRYSKLATELPTHPPSPLVRKVESCARQVEYKWTLEPKTNWIDRTRARDKAGRELVWDIIFSFTSFSSRKLEYMRDDYSRKFRYVESSIKLNGYHRRLFIRKEDLYENGSGDYKKFLPNSFS